MIIVNADDFGKTKSVNEAIIESFKNGWIQRTTLMVNMPYADEAVELARNFGAVPHGVAGQLSDCIGLHLNLTEGIPLTERIRRNPIFCDSEGRFKGDFVHNTKTRLYLNSSDMSQVYDELRAQIEKYQSYRLPLWHIDSHHHAHNNYSVFRPLRSLTKDYRFESVRKCRNLHAEESMYKKVYAKLLNHGITNICGHVSDYFGTPEDYIEGCRGIFGTLGYRTPRESEESSVSTSEKRLHYSKVFSQLEIELMVHPDMKNGIVVDNDNELGNLMEQVYCAFR